MTQSDPLPGFLIIGPFKSGTTWVYNYLLDRGDICLPKGVKETFFFDRHFDQGLDWYKSHFSGYDAARHLACGEVAPSYVASAGACQSIHQTLGTIPLIVIRRDPVARSWSHYLHMRRKGYTKSPLDQAVKEYPLILEASRFSQLLPAWEAHFGVENLIILSFEQLQEDPVAFAETLCDRLGIPRCDPKEERLDASNVANMTRFPRIAGLARRASEKLRRHRFHRLVNAGKAVHLHKIFYSGGNMENDRTLVLDDAARALLRNALAAEYESSSPVLPNMP